MHATCTDIPLPRDADHHPVASRAASLADRSVLVTGAHGFIGRHLVTHLVSAGAHVHAAVRPGRVRPLRSPAGRPGVTWHEGDLTDADATTRVVRTSGAEIVFHLASQVAGHRHPDLVLPMLDNNGRAAVNVMRAAHDLGDCRVVLAGSVEEPHDAGEAPCSPYAAAKLAATNYAMLFREQWGLPVTVLRPAMVYGPDQPDENKLIPYAIATMLDGHAPRLSSGTRPVDWIYIDDVCRAFLAAATRDHAVGVVADIGSGAGVTIADTVARLAALTGYRGPLEFGALADRAGDTARIADLAPARDMLGWRPETSLDAGLAQTVTWYADRHPVSVGGRAGSGRGGVAAGPDEEYH